MYCFWLLNSNSVVGPSHIPEKANNEHTKCVRVYNFEHTLFHTQNFLLAH